jgi:hypothetical protein
MSISDKEREEGLKKFMEAVIQLGQTVATYYSALINNGVSSDDAIELTKAYQEELFKLTVQR